MQDSRHKKYLGLPSLIRKSKSQVFAEIKERAGKKLAGWKGKLLSIGGREILIKVVAQAVPTYTMSCFQLPKTLCDDLESMMRNFWWAKGTMSQNLHRLVGKRCVSPNCMVAWASGTSKPLTLPYSQSKGGGSSLIPLLWLQGSLRLNTSLLRMSFTQGLEATQATLGEVFLIAFGS